MIFLKINYKFRISWGICHSYIPAGLMRDKNKTNPALAKRSELKECRGEGVPCARGRQSPSLLPKSWSWSSEPLEQQGWPLWNVLLRSLNKLLEEEVTIASSYSVSRFFRGENNAWTWKARENKCWTKATDRRVDVSIKKASKELECLVAK